MELLTAVITSIVDSLMQPVKKHLGFFFSSTKHVANMNNRFTKLNEAKYDTEEKKKTALINDQLIPDSLPYWLKKVEAITEKKERIPTSGNGCLNLKIKYEVGKCSFNILKEIDDLLEEQNKIEWSNKQRPLGMVRSSTRASTSKIDHAYDVTTNIFPSRTSIFYDVLKSIEQGNETQIMALWGPGGMGKTTMMEEIKKVVEKKGKFHYVLRVDIGTNFDPISTQKHIANHMGVVLTEECKEDRGQRLGRNFEEMSKVGKNILLILDDIWEAINLKDIGLIKPFPKGFKLLVTSRNEKVCIKMDIDTKSRFKIHGLEEADANSFFWETVRVSDEDEEGELRSIGEDILKRCGGLPIAIKTIALALRGEKKDAWDIALKNLQRHNLKDIEDLKDVVHAIFEISYNYLKNDDDKAIFILCGLFPDDFNISLEELLRYGWGLQFFSKADSLIEARKLTNTAVDRLIRANLLIESYTTGCVRMHDLARSFVLSSISKFKQASIVNHGGKSEWPTEDTHESCERILLTCKDMSEFPKEFYYPNLALLKLMNGDMLLKFPEDFYNKMEKLVVMAYDKMQNPLRAISLGYITSLRTLCLHSCSLWDTDISFLGNLVKLEVLSLAHCGICKLPSTLRKLKSLKLLDLTGCFNLCIDDGVFQGLKKLEELYMGVSRLKSIRFSDANCVEMEMLSRKLNALEVEFTGNILQPKNVPFKNLQRFRISMGCLLQHQINFTNEEYSFKNTLVLVTNRSDLLECKINELFSKTEELHLSVKDMIFVEDISVSPTQPSTFCNLKFLRVFECADLTHLFTIPIANCLKKLESLTVSSCPILKSLVRSCDSLNVMELPQLVALELVDLPNFASIILENDISTTQSLLNKKVVIPKLSKLKVHGLKKLKQIWACSSEADNVSMLKDIEICDCNSLVNLFPSNPMRLLTHLENLEVGSCCSIEVLFNIDLGEIEQHISYNSNLRWIHVCELEELKEVWRIHEVNNYDHLIVGFQAVETIHIERCKKFRNVFTPVKANFDMRGLTNVEIESDKDAEIINGISEEDDDTSIVGFPSYHLTRAFNQIHRIKFSGLRKAEVVFEIERPSTTNTDIQQPPLLPCLESLVLWNMEKMSHVWKCSNWNDFFILHPQSSFQNLTTIYLLRCKSIKYLFSPLMSKLLSSLKRLIISECEGIEEVVSNRDDDDDDDEALNTSTTTLFPCLDHLDLWSLRNLKHISGGVIKGKTNDVHDKFKFSQAGVVSWFLCQYPTEIYVDSCPSLSILIPSDAAPQMQKLQELTIWNCPSMVEVFESKNINNNIVYSSNSDQTSVSLARPITTTMHHELTNLRILSISKCDLLEYIFTFSTLERLKKLEELSISHCKAMKVIVKEEHEEELSKVVMPRLKSIKLNVLPNLEGFFVGTNIDFEWPSLDYVMIDDCPKMMMFTSGKSTAPKLKFIHTSLGKHNLECGLNFRQMPPPTSNSMSAWSFRNLVELHVKYKHRVKKIVPYNESLQLHVLEKISVERCESVEEVFEVTNNESQTVLKIPKLREMNLARLDNLKFIWKSSEWSTLEFPNLTRLSIDRCDSLEHVLTASMVGSLMQLQELHISKCSNLNVIVKIKKEECDGKVGEIKFPYLKFLKLYNLLSLNGFCLEEDAFSFPLLNTLEINDCPEIRIFTEGRSIAPKLEQVETSFGIFDVREDINSFITTKKQEGFNFEEILSIEDE